MPNAQIGNPDHLVNLVAHAVELRRRDGEVAGVERSGIVHPVSEGVCPRALAEPEVDLSAPPDAAAAGDQGLRAVPSDAGELAEFEQSICELNYEVQSC
jgi:hypothetical protein